MLFKPYALLIILILCIPCAQMLAVAYRIWFNYPKNNYNNKTINKNECKILKKNAMCKL